jgi:hypothetical protein
MPGLLKLNDPHHPEAPMQLGYTILYVPDVPATLDRAVAAGATPMV